LACHGVFSPVGNDREPGEGEGTVKNESGLDRVIRLVIAIAAFVGAFAVGFGSALGWVLVVAGAIALVTAAIGFCPLYRVFGLSTYRS
jgi:hypothetical protein